MKAFIFEDDLFCYVCVVVAVTEAQARELAEQKGVSLWNCTLRVESLEGLVVEGGGNG